MICIRKGKRAFANEYGSKVNLAIDKNLFVVSHETYHSNSHDSTLLKPALENWVEVTGTVPREVHTDRGYAQTEENREELELLVEWVGIETLGSAPHPCKEKAWFKRGRTLRATTEAVIGHLKQDHLWDRCRYKGKRGDQINACLGATAWNLNNLARRIS